MAEDTHRFEWARPRPVDREPADAATVPQSAGERPLVESPSVARPGSREPRATRDRVAGVEETRSRPDPAAGPAVRFRVAVGGPVEAAPVIRDGTVYLRAGTDRVLALDAGDGTERWTRQVDGRVGPPAAAEDVVVAGTDRGEVLGFDAATGRPEWTATTPGGVRARPATVEGTAYVADGDGRIVALHAADGSRTRSYRNGVRPVCSLAADGECLLLASLGGGAYVRGRTDGRERWRFKPAAGIRGVPVTDDETAYVGTVDDPGVYALSAVTGRERWRVGTAGGAWASPAVADGTVVVGTVEGVVHGFDAEDGTERWRVDAGGGVWSPPTVAGDAVIVATDAGSVLALDAEDGSLRWEHRASAPVIAPVAVADGTAYVADERGVLVALSLPG